MRQLGKVGALQRIGGRDGSDGNPNIERSEHHQRMIDAVGCEDGERPILSEPVTEQVLREHERCIAGFAVADGALSTMLLLDEEEAVRRFSRPAIEPIADALVITGQRFSGAHEESPVLPLGQLNIGREESYGPQRSVQYGLSVVKCTQCVELNRWNSSPQGL